MTLIAPCWVDVSQPTWLGAVLGGEAGIWSPHSFEAVSTLCAAPSPDVNRFVISEAVNSHS